MVVLGSHFRNTLRSAVFFLTLAIALAGCGNSCFGGFINNGTGFIFAKSTPAPSCFQNQTQGMVRVIAVKSAACETCATNAPQEHVFLTVRGIQLQRADVQDPSAWVEIAPQLVNEPRQIDLTAAQADVLVEQAMIPHGMYGEVRLQFLSDASQPIQPLTIHNACGTNGWNCLVASDGHVEPLRQADLIVNLKSTDAIPVLLSPDSTMDLQIRLGASPSALYLSDSKGVTVQTIIVGQTELMRQTESGNDNSIPTN